MLTGPLLNRELPADVPCLRELLRYFSQIYPPHAGRAVFNPDEYFPMTINSFKQARNRQQLTNTNDEKASGDAQEDSMEFLTFILDLYHETLLQLKPAIVEDAITGTVRLHAE